MFGAFIKGFSKEQFSELHCLMLGVWKLGNHTLFIIVTPLFGILPFFVGGSC